MHMATMMLKKQWKGAKTSKSVWHIWVAVEHTRKLIDDKMTVKQLSSITNTVTVFITDSDFSQLNFLVALNC